MPAEVLSGKGPVPPGKTEAESNERRVTAWIGQGVTVEGKISSAQDLRIDGHVEGTIEVGTHELVLGASSRVKANLVAKSILVGGTVIGNITATDRVQLQATGSVEGDISAPRLVIIDGAIVNGKVDTPGTRRG